MWVQSLDLELAKPIPITAYGYHPVCGHHVRFETAAFRDPNSWGVAWRRVATGGSRT